MELFNAARLEVIYQIYGEETKVKQNFPDVSQDATKEDLVQFSQLMASLTDEDHELNRILHSVTTEYTID